MALKDDDTGLRKLTIRFFRVSQTKISPVHGSAATARGYPMESSALGRPSRAR